MRRLRAAPPEAFGAETVSGLTDLAAEPGPAGRHPLPRLHPQRLYRRPPTDRTHDRLPQSGWNLDTGGLSRKRGVQTSATILPIRANGERPALHVPGATPLRGLSAAFRPQGTATSRMILARR